MARKSDRVCAFSEKTIKALIPPLKDRVDWWDETTPHLSCRVSSTGVKSFYWIGRTGGEWNRVMIGAFPDMSVQGARQEANRLSGLAAVGSPTVSRRNKAKGEWTLGELYTWYMENLSKPHKRTWRKDEQIYRDGLSQWSDRKVSKVLTEDLQKLHVKTGETRGPYAANKILELLGTMYRQAKELFKSKFPHDDPTAGIQRFPRIERERFLDSEELPRFLKAVQHLQRQISRDIILTALYTGARRSNVCAMKWADISLKTGIWIVEHGDSKNKRQMNIVLSSEVIEILTRRRKIIRGPWVFPSHSKTGHYSYPKDAVRSAQEMAGLTDVRFHDLRRTLGSWMAVDQPLQVIGKQLGHKSLKSTQIYARLANKTQIGAVGGVTSAMSAAEASAEPLTIKRKRKPRKKPD